MAFVGTGRHHVVMKQPVLSDNCVREGRPRTRHRGQGTAEYAIVLALVAIIAISALLFLSNGIGDVLANVSNGFGPSASSAVPTVPAKATPTAKPTKTPKATKTPKPPKP